MRVQFIIQGKSTEVEVEEGRTLLDAALIARLSPPYSCMEGSCGSCEAFIEQGETTEDKENSHVVRTCQALPKSDYTIVNYDKVSK